MEHFIHELEISNFKSIRHQKIEGCRRVNVFIGYPNVGKSNVLEAIGSLGIVEKILEQWPKHVLLTDFIRLDSLSSCFFNGITTDEGAVVRSNLRTAVFRWQDFVGHLEYQCLVDSHQTVDADFNENFQAENFSRSDSFQLPVTEAEVLETLKGKVRPYSFRGLVQPSDSRIHKAGLQFPFGENLASSFQLSGNLKNDVSGLFAEFGFKVLFENGSFKIFRETESGNIFSVSPNLIADTLQRLIFHKAAIASNQNTVLLFEEPEAHMFPPYIRKLTWDIIQSKTNQFFITTHSPFVLDSLMEDAADELSVYLLDYKDGETKIQRLSEEHFAEIREYGVDLFFNIESYLKRGQSDPA